MLKAILMSSAIAVSSVAFMGCDSKLAEKKTETKVNGETVKKDKVTVSETPSGAIKKEETHVRDNAPNKD